MNVMFPPTGVLTLIRPLDRETQAEYNLEIEASDGVQSSTAHVRITVTDVNDKKPAFDKALYSFDIPEDARTGTTVGRVSAFDADLGDNGEVSYAMVSHWGRNKFSLQQNSGVFTLIDNLDYEEVRMWTEKMSLVRMHIVVFILFRFGQIFKIS